MKDRIQFCHERQHPHGRTKLSEPKVAGSKGTGSEENPHRDEGRGHDDGCGAEAEAGISATPKKWRTEPQQLVVGKPQLWTAFQSTPMHAQKRKSLQNSHHLRMFTFHFWGLQGLRAAPHVTVEVTNSMSQSGNLAYIPDELVFGSKWLAKLKRRSFCC